MDISSATQSAQLLKAQQAWESRRTASVKTQPADIQTPAKTVTPQTLATQKAARPVATAPLPVTDPLQPTANWQQTVAEVKTIAQHAGYVDVSEQDIRRAYTYGESLLADYSV